MQMVVVVVVVVVVVFNYICNYPFLMEEKCMQTGVVLLTIFYYINCSALASGSKSRKMVSHMCG